MQTTHPPLALLPLIIAVVTSGCAVGLDGILKTSARGNGSPGPAPSAGRAVDPASEPAAAEPGAAPSRPAYCAASSGEGDLNVEQLQDAFSDPKERHDFSFFLRMHWSMCKREPKPGVVAEGMKMRATIMRELGLTEADMKDLGPTLAKSFREGPIGFDTSFSGGGSGLDYGGLPNALAANPLEQQSTVTFAFSYHPTFGLWLADSLGDRMTELARGALVQACLKSGKALFIAACLDDAHRLDRRKLWTELDDPAFKPDVRLSLKFWFGELTKRIADQDKQNAARIREDAAYKTVFVDVPSATTKEWAAFYKRNPELVALTRELEFGSMSKSRKATAGCEAKITPHLTQHLKALKPDPVPQVRIGGATTPAGWIVNAAAYYCAVATDGAWAGLERYLGEELTHGMWLRGPRSAIVEKLLARSPDLKFDERGRAIADDMPRDAYRTTKAFGVGASGSGDHGIVAKVTPRGGVVAITFADGERDELTCEKEVKTERWYYDRVKGELGPVYQCVKFGSRRVKTKHEPTTFPKAMMTGVEPGRLVHFTRGAKLSTPAYVWDSESKRKLIAAYGIAR